MSEPLRLAVVGVGRMGGFHVRALADLDTVAVVGVADTNPDLARLVGQEIGAADFASPIDLLERDDVEAWLIATPTLTHPDLVTMALGAGLHVLCEKPLALDPGESGELGGLAMASGRVLQVGFWRRFSPPWAMAKQLLAEGAIGRPILLRLAQWDADPPPAAFCDPLVSGGLAIDCGVHEFDLVEWLTGSPVERVTARNLRLVDRSLQAVGDVDNLLAVLDLPEDAAATVDLTRNCRYGDDVRTEILGENGAIFVDLLPVGRTRLATAGGIELVAGSKSADPFAAGVRNQAAAFADAVRGKRVDLPGAAASTRALIIGQAVQRSAATGAPVDL